MRRMYSDGQVVKVVNKAIDDGEIQAGGLTPEQKEKVDNSLQLPESAPAAQQLVGINTSGEQNAIGIGEGLSIENNSLVSQIEIYKFDFNATNTLAISDDLYTKLQEKNILIMVYNANIGDGYANGALFSHEYVNNIWYNITLAGTTNASGTSLNGAYYSIQKRLQIKVQGSAGNYSLKISTNSNTSGICTSVEREEVFSFDYDTPTGTKTWSSATDNARSKYYSYFLLRDGAEWIRMYITYSTFNTTPIIFYAEGKGSAYSYSLEWNTTSKAYKITRTALNA